MKVPGRPSNGAASPPPMPKEKFVLMAAAEMHETGRLAPAKETDGKSTDSR